MIGKIRNVWIRNLLRSIGFRIEVDFTIEDVIVEISHGYRCRLVALDSNGYFRGTSLEDPAIWYLVRIQDITRVINVLNKED